MSSNESSRAEYLEQGSGSVLPREGRRGPSRKKLVLGGAGVAGLALVGGGVWAAVSFLGQGAQPAEALPATTLGYAAVDLDPSGGQKIEALRMLGKFPAFEEEIGLDTDDDLRRAIFDEAAAGCPDLDYGDDVEPWLGQRFAVAAVDLGEDQPAPVAVVQVQDADAAGEGMAALRDCAADGDDLGGWAVEGEWMIVAETESIAQEVVDATADGTLADDTDYQEWTDEVGDAGVVSMYAAPEAGQVLLDSVDDMAGLTGDAVVPAPMGGLPDELRGALEDFGGAAATLRFSDGALELEVAADGRMTQQGLPVSQGGDDVLATLPAGTAAALGVGFADGWFSTLLDQLSTYVPGMAPDEMIAELEVQTGLELPDDVETLLGESAALAVSPDIDGDALVNSDTPAGLPFGLKVQGDPAAIEEVLDKLRTSMGPVADELLLSETDGDTIAVSPSEDYLAELSGDGGLGDTETFQNVVREAESASGILFVDFDAGDGWLVELFGDDPTAVENLEPLEGLGMSSWVDDEVGHAVLRVTTD